MAPSARRRGLARSLMDVALDHLRTAGGVEQVQLLVTSSQAPARALYLSLGFTRFGFETRAMKLADGRYLDEEHMVLIL